PEASYRIHEALSKSEMEPVMSPRPPLHASHLRRATVHAGEIAISEWIALHEESDYPPPSDGAYRGLRGIERNRSEGSSAGLPDAHHSADRAVSGRWRDRLRGPHHRCWFVGSAGPAGNSGQPAWRRQQHWRRGCRALGA